MTNNKYANKEHKMSGIEMLLRSRVWVQKAMHPERNAEQIAKAILYGTVSFTLAEAIEIVKDELAIA